MVSIDNIIELVRDYVSPEDLGSIRKAFEFAEKAYQGKSRESGEAYIYHPLAVTHILASMRLDVHTLVAGLLHSVLKAPAGTTEDELRKLFGEDVAALVSGATKIDNFQFNSRLAYQAENIRKMLLAMSKDIRVLLLKLADRLHDMQTLSFTVERQLEIARETMDLYAPLASRLGIDWMKRELEDLSFAYLYPDEYESLSEKIESSLVDRTVYVEEVKKQIQDRLKLNGLKDFRILGRPKHLYSIYRKLIAQNIPLEKVYDKVAFRIIVRTVSECYAALGVVHSMLLPVASRFKDFISSPKANMYQSLHTSVVGPYGEFMEIQIRTEEMDRIANDGIAAHWAYKEGKDVSTKDAKLFHWLKQLVHGLQELRDPDEFLEAVKGELVQSEMYVLTPNGDVKELKAGSTPLDFAYSIHTEVGNRCTGAKVNGRIVPLKYQLKNGEMVEILTSPKQTPNRGWLSLVKTGRAKSRIRQWLRQEEQGKSLKLGREICERELRRHNFSLKKVINTGHLKQVLKALSCNSLDDLLLHVGRGKIMVQAIVKAVLPEEFHKEGPAERQLDFIARRQDRKKKEQGDVLQVDGIDGVLMHVSQCCMPVPGDDIMGFITAGRGISVHKATCSNLMATDSERWIEVSWSGNGAVPHRAQIFVVGQDKKGLLAELSNTISMEDANIMNVEARTTSDNLSSFRLVVEVEGRAHLDRLLQRIRQLNGILEARRK